ncbi:MAG: ferrous iron transport protein A [Chloroflexi bacterium]|nr:ferrous iron transport protein A [Chloroflexota bacterium]
MTIRSLEELEPGEKGRVVKVGGNGSITRRFRDMGLVPGSEVEVERVAPLGDPVEIKIKGYHLAIRREEAASILVEAAPLMPLALVSPGEVVQVVNVRTGRGLSRRLADMGLLPGTEVKVITSGPGPLVLEVKGTRLALGHGIAQKVMVAEKK